MKYIVVIDLDASKWEVLDVSFNTCPNSPVKYQTTSLYTPVPIIERCNDVEIINKSTGAKGTATPIKIN